MENRKTQRNGKQNGYAVTVYFGRSSYTVLATGTDTLDAIGNVAKRLRIVSDFQNGDVSATAIRVG